MTTRDVERPEKPLVSTEWLQNHLDDPGLVVLEISRDPEETAPYFKGHIAGSLFAYWKDLLWDESDREFPSPAVMAARLAELGVGSEGTVALVGDPVQFATYAYWVLTMTGQEHRIVHVDGGREKWVLEGRPLVSSRSEPRIGTVVPGNANQSARIGRDEVRAGLDDPHRLLIDVRSPEEFRGERVSPPEMGFDHGAERKGHIPRARHLYYMDLLTQDGAFLPPEVLLNRFDDLPVETSEVVTYCRLSHRATLAWFALTRIHGVPDVRVYDGSWTEWGSIVGFPIER